MFIAVKRLLIIGLLSSAVLNGFADVILIGHPDLPETSITVRDIGDIYLGRKRDWGEVKVAPVTLRQSTTHAEFLKKFTGRSESQFRRHWRNIVFSGQGQLLKSFESEADVVAYVAATPGAIGYVSSEADLSSVVIIQLQQEETP